MSMQSCVRTYGTLVGRSLLGLLFLYSGVGILLAGTAGTAGFYESLGIPMAGFLVWVVVILKIGAGGALILGYRTYEAAGALIIFTLIATGLAHLSLEDMNLFKNLSIIGGLLYVMAYGAGDGWKLGGTATPTSADSV